MRKIDGPDDEELGELEDKTETLTLRSKRTERARKKQAKKVKNPKSQSQNLLDLPYELVLGILTYLRPSDIFNLQRVSRAFRNFIILDERRIARSIISWRYVCLEKCFRLPILMKHIDPNIQPYVQSLDRQELLVIHKKPYLHVQPPDPAEICTCLTCLLRWSSLCLIPDFAHWQKHLDAGEPIPMIPRGVNPKWNQVLISSNADIVRKALHSPLWHARLFEAHLDSTTRSIRRQAANKGNRRRRFRMEQEDVDLGSDLFLERSGPPSFDFPFHRDNYYMLEAYLPNRGWSVESEKWMYMPAEQHDIDINYITKWAERVKTKNQEAKITEEK
ncbi:uncharacterized protein GGS22DRAFT_84285 [Annulohypoxylon maeteangense]|uniref:uncharacterized protein n=1 Tax=Annulohypoxylon maeteangense TaxID=1927788 RepID=UPI002008AD53|nr:uncharacterized protein GGS22DRAFT_84285 [Annulohypoxylon maeteangense]KAI0880471.1 hypothetical protein GGS22DRAFT_84285 [Annulohypoxylon maeteangense]